MKDILGNSISAKTMLNQVVFLANIMPSSHISSPVIITRKFHCYNKSHHFNKTKNLNKTAFTIESKIDQFKCWHFEFQCKKIVVDICEANTWNWDISYFTCVQPNVNAYLDKITCLQICMFFWWQKCIVS